MKHKLKTVMYARKRKGVTNYKKRLALLKGKLPRLIIRKTNTRLIAQIAHYRPDGDQILITTTSDKLSQHGWNYSKKNLPSAYLTGLLLGKEAKNKNVTKAILDIGLHTPVKGSRVYALLKGAKDAGLEVPASQAIMPKQERLKGEHIANYFEKNPALFSGYAKQKLDAKNMPKDFEEVKKRIIGK
jgi:large subunit ribosomal protein L18